MIFHDLRNPSRSRLAFTLVEILVVIAIIGILAGLASWGAFAMIGNQQRRNTESSLRVIDRLLHDRWQAVIAEAKKETPSPAVMALAGDPARARVIWIKVRLAEAFPINYYEVNQTLPVPASTPLTIVNAYIPSNQRKPHFNKYQSLLAGKNGPVAGESSACLLMALKTLGADGVSVEDHLKTFVKDTDNDGVPELVDAWSRPLLYLRFPIVITDPQTGQPVNPATAGGRTAKFADPVDTDGTLINAAWYNALPALPLINSRRTFEGQFHPVSPAPVAPVTVPNNAYYTIPIVVSAGKDGNMAVAVDGTQTPPGSRDNLFNYMLRGN